MSIVKFLITPSIMIVAGKGVVETMLICSSGAAIGVLIFYYFGEFLFGKLDKMLSKKHQRKFTRMNKLIVKIKRKFGIYGLMLISVILSVPISGLLVARLFNNRSSVILLIVAFGFWSAVLTITTYSMQNLFNG